MALHDSMTKVFLPPFPVPVDRESALNLEFLMRLVEATLQIVLIVVAIVVALAVVLTVRRGWDRVYHMGRVRQSFEEQHSEEIRSLLQLSRRQQDDLAKVVEWISRQNAINIASTDAPEGAWRKQGEQALYATYDLLSATEIALAVFTSPASFPSIDRGPLSSRVITATAKEAYLWAGAVAFVMEKRPDTSDLQIRTALDRALRKTVRQNFSSFTGWSVSPLPFEAQTRLLESFVHEAGVQGSFREIEARTNEAYELLLWRGLIEDPLWKGVSGAALAVALIVPVHWTSTQNAFSVNALGWRYTQQGEGKSAERSFKLRVKEVSEVVMDEMVPSLLKIIDELPESSDHAQDDSVRGGEQSFGKMSPTGRLQRALSRAGFDPGPVDGIFGPRTRDALMGFQSASGLPATGNPDTRSIQMLGLKPNLAPRRSDY